LVCLAPAHDVGYGTGPIRSAGLPARVDDRLSWPHHSRASSLPRRGPPREVIRQLRSHRPRAPRRSTVRVRWDRRSRRRGRRTRHACATPALRRSPSADAVPSSGRSRPRCVGPAALPGPSPLTPSHAGHARLSIARPSVVICAQTPRLRCRSHAARAPRPPRPPLCSPPRRLRRPAGEHRGIVAHDHVARLLVPPVSISTREVHPYLRGPRPNPRRRRGRDITGIRVQRITTPSNPTRRRRPPSHAGVAVVHTSARPAAPALGGGDQPWAAGELGLTSRSSAVGKRASSVLRRPTEQRDGIEHPLVLVRIARWRGSSGSYRRGHAAPVRATPHASLPALGPGPQSSSPKHPTPRRAY